MESWNLTNLVASLSIKTVIYTSVILRTTVYRYYPRSLHSMDQFGQNSLKNPFDVKLARTSIYILDESNPCLHLFNHNPILQKSVLSRGEGFQLYYPQNFYIDNSNNILISDNIGSICIFNPEFELIHRIPITDPTGVAVDKQRRIIVVCEGGNKRLNIF